MDERTAGTWEAVGASPAKDTWTHWKMAMDNDATLKFAAIVKASAIGLPLSAFLQRTRGDLDDGGSYKAA